MGKYWVVDGAKLSFSKGTGDSKITGAFENDVKAGLKNNVKNVYAGNIGVSVSQFLSETVTNGDGVGNGTISGTSVNLANGKNILLEGDSVTVTINGTAFYSQTDPKHPVVDTVTVKIESAGQTEVSSN